MPRRSIFLLLVLVAGCGREPASAARDLGGFVTMVPDGGEDASAPDGSPSTDGALLGVWKIAGTDARGAYEGELELRGPEAGPFSFLRVVRYPGVKVEDERELWWAWTGTANRQGGGFAVSAQLARADFVRSRGGVTRTDADKVPAVVTGTIDGSTNGVSSAHYTLDGAAMVDAMSARKDSGPEPIFAVQRTSAPVNAAPSAATKSSLFALYASFHARPDVMPYVNDPAFQLGVADVIVDKTDFDFYRAHPRALRVVNKIIDSPSLGETLSRASAFGQTLVKKAAIFDAEMPTTFLEATSGQTPAFIAYGNWIPGEDGALWTACYVASQAFRYLQTGEAAALANVVKSIEGIQVLMEITPDQTTFARTLRPATGAPTGVWKAGTGPFAGYEYWEGGNNDMFKGLFYGTLTAYMVLCDPLQPGMDALCARMRKNAKHMFDDLSVAQGNADNNRLMAAWLSAYTNNNFSNYATAIATFSLLKSSIEQANFQSGEITTVDFSGTHLGFTQFIGLWLLSERAPLPGTDTKTTLMKGITKMRDDFQVYRMGLWSVLFAKLANNPSSVDAEDARWRLREFAAPKLQLDVDHRVSASFVMSPYPYQPWKNDWTTTNRTKSLHGYPAFELPIDVYYWRIAFDYERSSVDLLYPGNDYLHAYWLGRQLGLFDAVE